MPPALPGFFGRSSARFLSMRDVELSRFSPWARAKGFEALFDKWTYQFMDVVSCG